MHGRWPFSFTAGRRFLDDHNASNRPRNFGEGPFVDYWGSLWNNLTPEHAAGDVGEMSCCGDECEMGRGL